MAFKLLRFSLQCLFLIHFIKQVLCVGSFQRPTLLMNFDFIVVGGGSAGAVVGSRLTEDQNVRVLLLEAGTENILLGILSDIPATLEFLQLSDYDWQYKTVPQTGACLGMTGHQCPWPRGKVLGGSSTINFMLYTRGNKLDYDRWASLGNTGWDYNSVLPYFKKSEDYTGPYIGANDAKYHGTGGNLTVSNINYKTPLEYAFIAAGLEYGLNVRDINGENQNGIMNVVGTVRQGARCSTAKAFLQSANSRQNLIILQGALVVKVLFDDSKRAIGVQYNLNGIIFKAYASKEVILSAGSINTPQLLMLSGVGPKTELDKFNIPVIANVPGVGENLQDHISCAGLIHTVDQPVATILLSALNLSYLVNWLLYGEGPLAVLGGIEGIGYVNTPFGNQTDDWPDIELLLFSATAAADGGLRLRYDFGLSDEVWKKVFEPILNKDAFTIIPILLRPKSRGVVRLQSNNPFDAPLMNPNYFNETEDLKVLVAGMKIALTFGRSIAFRQFDAQLYPKIWPGCESFEQHSDDYLACLARHYSQTIYHPAGTCKMGPLNTDPMAVVDPHLRVRGVNGLRVVDASIMPFIVSGHINAATIMIAEKASDMIKETWNIPVQ